MASLLKGEKVCSIFRQLKDPKAIVRQQNRTRRQWSYFVDGSSLA